MQAAGGGEDGRRHVPQGHSGWPIVALVVGLAIAVVAGVVAWPHTDHPAKGTPSAIGGDQTKANPPITRQVDAYQDDHGGFHFVQAQVCPLAPLDTVRDAMGMPLLQPLDPYEAHIPTRSADFGVCRYINGTRRVGLLDFTYAPGADLLGWMLANYTPDAFKDSAGCSEADGINRATQGCVRLGRISGLGVKAYTMSRFQGDRWHLLIVGFEQAGMFLEVDVRSDAADPFGDPIRIAKAMSQRLPQGGASIVRIVPEPNS